MSNTDTSRYAHADEAYTNVLADILKHGKQVETTHIGKLDTRTSSEILGHTFVIDNPVDRLIFNPERHFSVIEAVARFVFFAAGSNRLSDIAFYQPAVRKYSDDGFSLPGSNYGMRILQPRPGLNQIDGVVETLKNEPGSRRASTVVWTPDDAVRVSSDIPCAFGTSYFLRNGKLDIITMMRPNNAVLLLPYNVFEFTLLGELVARRINVEVGSYTHFSCSIHVYEDDREKALKSIDVASRPLTRVTMPSMPADPDPWEQVKELIKLEAELRNGNVMSRRYNHYELIDSAKKILNDYWLAFYKVLVIHCLARIGEFDEAVIIARTLPNYFKELVMSEINWKRESTKNKIAVPNTTLDAYTGPIHKNMSADSESAQIAQENENIARAFAMAGEEEVKVLERLRSFRSRLEAKNEKISKTEFNSLFKQMIAKAAIVATRSFDADKYFSDQELKGELDKIRKRKG